MLTRCCLLAVLAAPTTLAAQHDTLPSPPKADSVLANTHSAAADPAERHDERVIRGIVIRRQNVFDSTETSVFYARWTNAVHITTKEYVVARELLLDSGQVYDSAAAEETGRNLRRLGVFRDVSIDTISADSGVYLRVVTRDAWTTRPYFSFRLSGGEIAFAAGVTESNLFGTANAIDLRYTQNPDRTGLRLGLATPRLISSKVSFAGFATKLSDGTQWQGALTYPFYRLSDTQGYAGWAEGFNGRILRFFRGDTTATDSVQRRYALAYVDAAHAIYASESGYLRVGMRAQVRRDDFVPESFTGTMPETYTGALDFYVVRSTPRFIIAHNYIGLGPQEDVDLSSTVRLGVTVAPSAFGYQSTGVGVEGAFLVGLRFHKGFTYFTGSGTALWSSSGLDSARAIVGGTVAVQPTRRDVAVLHADGGWLHNGYPGEEFDLGLTQGPRAFPAHSFTGDRMFYVLSEYRHTIITNLFRLANIGLAVFGEYGGAWYTADGARTGVDAGFGIRIGSSRLASINGATRIDIARRFENDALPAQWQLVVGTGFPFQLIR